MTADMLPQRRAGPITRRGKGLGGRQMSLNPDVSQLDQLAGGRWNSPAVDRYKAEWVFGRIQIHAVHAVQVEVAKSTGQDE